MGLQLLNNLVLAEHAGVGEGAVGGVGQVAAQAQVLDELLDRGSAHQVFLQPPAQGRERAAEDIGAAAFHRQVALPLELGLGAVLTLITEAGQDRGDHHAEDREERLFLVAAEQADPLMQVCGLTPCHRMDSP